MARPIRLAIKDSESGNYYTALKIMPYSSGGFAVILPRHTGSSTGVLEQYRMLYEDYGTKMKIVRDSAQQYRAEDIVKLSYHQDGFVQFSSTTNRKIRSGKNEDGTPKGLGVQSWGLDDPVSTGASIALSLWGLGELSALSSSKVDNAYVFETGAAKSHFAYPVTNDDIMYGFEIYIIKKSLNGYIFTVNGRKYATLTYMQPTEGTGYFTRLRTQVRLIEIPDQDIVLGVQWSRFGVKRESSFGYNLLGPTDGSYGLMATYPEGAVDGADSLRSIMYDFSVT